METQLFNLVNGVIAGLTVKGIEVFTGFLRKKYGKIELTEAEIKEAASEFAKIHGATLETDKVIDILVKSGFLSIRDTKMHSEEGTTIGSKNGALFEFTNSVSTTPGTKVDTGRGGSISGAGHMQQSGDNVEIASPGGIHFVFGGDRDE